MGLQTEIWNRDIPNVKNGVNISVAMLVLVIVHSDKQEENNIIKKTIMFRDWKQYNVVGIN